MGEQKGSTDRKQNEILDIIQSLVEIESRGTVVFATPGSLERGIYATRKGATGLTFANYGYDMESRAHPAVMLYMEGNSHTHKKALENIMGITRLSYKMFLRHSMLNKGTFEPLLSRVYSNILGIDNDCAENQYQNRKLIMDVPKYLQDGRVTAVFVFAYNKLVNLFEKWRQDNLIDYIKLHPTTQNGRRGYILWACKAGNKKVHDVFAEYAKTHEGHIPDFEKCKCSFYCKNGDPLLQKTAPDPNDFETVFVKRRNSWKDAPTEVEGQRDEWCTTSGTGSIINVSLTLDTNGRFDTSPAPGRVKMARLPIINASKALADSIARNQLLIHGVPKAFIDDITNEIQFSVRDTDLGRMNRLLEKLETHNVSKYPKMARLIDAYVGEMMEKYNASKQ
ncbi:MAG: hypothetical protein JRN21_09375 [Nitrososphaerota archaeon]|nr:hypothetical protein [Nitrososphaerota archaeon]